MRVTPRRAAVLPLLLAACGGAATPPSQGGTDVVTGTERFGWVQPAADAGELATFRYAFYVDDVRSEVGEVACGPGEASGRFACTSSLPAMAAGPHMLQIAAFLTDAGVLRESARSAAVRVVKQ